MVPMGNLLTRSIFVMGNFTTGESRMKRFLAIAFVCAFSCCLYAQVVDATVCEILKNPVAFNGKIIRVKGTVVAGFDQFVVKGIGCPPAGNNNIWLSYPEGTKASAGPAMMVQIQPARNFTGTVAVVERTPVQLDMNKDFKQFDSLLATQYKKGGMCLGCNKFEVTATLVGRLDAVEKTELQRDKAGKIIGLGGFGHLNAYAVRLVLQSVSDVISKEIDYSQALAITKDDIQPVTYISEIENITTYVRDTAKSYDYLRRAQLERAVDVYGTSEDDHGVEVRSGPANEAIVKYETKTKQFIYSSDGLVFNCIFNLNRVFGLERIRATVFAGENVADVRNPLPGGAGASLFDMEIRAWKTTILDVVANKQKTLTLPGGIIVWNYKWPAASINKNVDDALNSFLANEALLTR